MWKITYDNGYEVISDTKPTKQATPFGKYCDTTSSSYARFSTGGISYSEKVQPATQQEKLHFESCQHLNEYVDPEIKVGDVYVWVDLDNNQARFISRFSGDWGNTPHTDLSDKNYEPENLSLGSNRFQLGWNVIHESQAKEYSKEIEHFKKCEKVKKWVDRDENSNILGKDDIQKGIEEFYKMAKLSVDNIGSVTTQSNFTQVVIEEKENSQNEVDKTQKKSIMKTLYEFLV